MREIDVFITKSRAVLAHRGEKKAAAVCGRILIDAQVFSSEGLTIKSGPGALLEIEISAPIQPDNLHNPVVMVNETGEVFRTHGEWIYAREAMDALYSSIG